MDTDRETEARKKQFASVDDAIGQIMLRHSSTPAELAQNIPIYFRRYYMSRFLARYEIFRKVIDLPGDLVELGVFRGESFMSFANFLEIHCMGNRTKKLYGFDHWKGLQDLQPEDGPDYAYDDKKEGGYLAGEQYFQELKELIEIWDNDRFASSKKRLELVEGDVLETVPAFIEKHPGIRICLLHLDLDLYKPTSIALEYLYPKVVPGGIVILDEYALTEFAGESQAVDEYFAGKPPRMHAFPWMSTPGAYFVKE